VEARAKRMPAAARLFACARERVLSAAAGSGADALLCSPGAAGPTAAGVAFLPQRGMAFGERLRNAVADARLLGYEHVVVVPGDVPGLRSRHLREAFRLLRAHDMVLGPSPDGGVYLLGLRGASETALAGVPWCTRGVFASLHSAARRAAVLAPLADLDGHAHLRALRADGTLDDEFSALVAALLARADAPASQASPQATDPHRSPLASRPPPAVAA
jgi:uncharacterized protein